MAKLSIIEMRKAKALEQINMRLARIEEKLGISEEPVMVVVTGDTQVPTQSEPAGEGETQAPARTKPRSKSK